MGFQATLPDEKCGGSVVGSRYADDGGKRNAFVAEGVARLHEVADIFAECFNEGQESERCKMVKGDDYVRFEVNCFRWRIDVLKEGDSISYIASNDTKFPFPKTMKTVEEAFGIIVSRATSIEIVKQIIENSTEE